MDRAALQEQFGLLGESQAIRHVIDKIRQVASTDITVLLQGESGVGKDVTAKAIHHLSARSKGELVIVNCGAIPEGIIESELFGHEKGAFTGAHEAREGYFERADGGTIFLDEIGETPKNVQVKLLRVLESGEFSRVGSSRLRKTDVRVIAATNRDMWQLVQDGTFREDLYYRLDTVKIHLPPLRERQEDILLLFRKFAADFAVKYDSAFKGFSDEAVELLLSYRWPGNIRELRNVAEQLVVLEKGQFIDKERLRSYLKGRQQLGSTDHLPSVRSSDEPNRGDSSNPFAPSSVDTRLIYRALLEMKGELTDIRALLNGILHPSYAPNPIRALPPGLPRTMDPNDITTHLNHRYRELGRTDLPDGELHTGRFSSGSLGASGNDSLPATRRDVDPRSGGGPPAYPAGPGYGGSSRGNPGDARSVADQDNGDWSHRPGRIEPIQGQPIDAEEAEILDFFAGETMPSIEQAERFLIEQALKRYDGNRRKVSEALGISERTLYRKLDQYGLAE